MRACRLWAEPRRPSMAAVAALTVLFLGATQLLLNSSPATAGRRHLLHSSRTSLSTSSGDAVPLGEQRPSVPNGVLAWSPLLGIDTTLQAPDGPNPVQLTRCINEKYVRKVMPCMAPCASQRPSFTKLHHWTGSDCIQRAL